MNSSDAALEVFLQAISPGLESPRIAVTPNAMRIRMNSNENRVIVMRISNVGRGYLFGSIEMSNRVSGVELSSASFGVNAKNNEVAEIRLTFRGPQLTYTRFAELNIIINSNDLDAPYLRIPVSLTIAQNPFSTAAGLWLTTLPISIFMSIILYQLFSDQLFPDPILSGFGPVIVFGFGLLGNVLFNGFWSSSARGDNNGLADYLLALLAYVGFAILGFIALYLILIILILIALALSLSILGGGRNR